MRRLVAVAAALALAWAGPSLAAREEIDLREDFESGAARWIPTDPAMWEVAEEDGNHFYRLKGKSRFEPPHRSPHSIALLGGVDVGDFDLRLRLRSTTRDYAHRDLCVVFGYQDAGHFYYAHLGRTTDDHANQIFLVNGAPRAKISKLTSEGIPWDDAWHTVRITRRVADGRIEVYFDDLERPVMTARDATFGWGQIGLGSFDDAGDFDDVQLRGSRSSARAMKCEQRSHASPSLGRRFDRSQCHERKVWSGRADGPRETNGRRSTLSRVAEIGPRLRNADALRPRRMDPEIRGRSRVDWSVEARDAALQPPSVSAPREPLAAASSGSGRRRIIPRRSRIASEARETACRPRQEDDSRRAA